MKLRTVAVPRDPVVVDMVLPDSFWNVLFPIDMLTGTILETEINFMELVSVVRIPLEIPEVSTESEEFRISSVDCPVTLEKPAIRLTFPEKGKVVPGAMVTFRLPPDGAQVLLKKYQEVVVLLAVPL